MSQAGSQTGTSASSVCLAVDEVLNGSSGETSPSRTSRVSKTDNSPEVVISPGIGRGRARQRGPASWGTPFVGHESARRLRGDGCGDMMRHADADQSRAVLDLHPCCSSNPAPGMPASGQVGVRALPHLGKDAFMAPVSQTNFSAGGADSEGAKGAPVSVRRPLNRAVRTPKRAFRPPQEPGPQHSGLQSKTMRRIQRVEPCQRLDPVEPVRHRPHG
jgi:hypothetical protein